MPEYRLAGLTGFELQKYGLDELLDQRPENVEMLLKTESLWQIVAFADLYADKIRQTRAPKREDYERAMRLYEHCLKSRDAANYVERQVAELNKLWKK